MDAAGDTFSFNQTPAEAADSTNCTVSVPAHPLSARGLATPWVLGDGCTWENGDTEGVFIDATILAPDGRIQVYNPLVITEGTQPEVAPAPPTIARGSQVILSVGFNGNALAVVGPGVRQGNCIDALGNSLINQTPQCNAANFYRMANFEIARGTLKIPAIGTGKDGQACQTTRDFALIDQDQSDNAVAHYLFNPNTGQTTQATAANQANLPGDTVETNGSDNGLLDSFIDPTLGCTPFTATNPTNPAGASASQALNELSARQHQKGTVAQLPVNDPQLLVGGQFSIGKTNVYRIETDMPTLPFDTNTTQNAAQYCQNMVNIATPRLQLDAPMETGTASPVPDLGNNLTTFLAARLSGSFDNLNCKNYGLTDPVTLTLDANGVATGATYNTTPQTIGGGGNGRVTAAGGTTGGPTSCRADTGTCRYAQIMTGFTPEQIPVLSGLARGFGVFDHWPDRHAAGAVGPGRPVHRTRRRRPDVLPRLHPGHPARSGHKACPRSAAGACVHGGCGRPGHEPVHARQDPGPGDTGVRGPEPHRDRGPAQGPQGGTCPQNSC